MMARLRQSEAQQNADALNRRGTAYSEPHARSWSRRNNRGASRPRGLRTYLRWFLAELALEVPPQKIHEGYDKIGEGGTPKYHAAFMAWLTAHPCAIDQGAPEHVRGSGLEPSGFYLRPLRCAIYRLARSRRPVAGYLLDLAGSGGDWLGTGAQHGMIPEYADIFTAAALGLLWDQYSAESIGRAA